MGGMPYYVEKGMSFSVFEDFVNSSRSRLETALTDLRAGLRIDQIGGLDSVNLDVPGVPDMVDLAARIRHLNTHWFGMVQNGTGQWEKLASYDEVLVDSSGSFLFWHNYAGDVEAIMRATMIRACEVALGLEHGQALDKATRHPAWPIELFWKCGQNWFEGWVSWTVDRTKKPKKGKKKSRHGLPAVPRQDGHVTVLMCTPTAGHPIRQTATAPANDPAANAPDYSTNPPHRVAKGLVLVTNERHTQVFDTAEQYPPATHAGMLPAPLRMYWRAEGDVVAVSPSEPDGGVLSSGRQW